MENNLFNELMDLITKEVDYRIKNNIALADESVDEKSSTESLANISLNRNSTRTYFADKIFNYNIFSPNSSSKLSAKTALSDKKKTLNILPIRNLINLKKSQNIKSKNKSKENNKKKDNGKKVQFSINQKHEDSKDSV